MLFYFVMDFFSMALKFIKDENCIYMNLMTIIKCSLIFIISKAGDFVMMLKVLFGHQVKLLRKYRNMTQEGLSELVDIDIRQLARIESGESFATSETIEKICTALKISYRDMFDFEYTDNEKNENMTCESMIKFKQNYLKLNRLIHKIAMSDAKTEYLTLAVEALDKKIAREKLKSILFGMVLK